MDEITYTYILTKTDGTYLGWSKAPKKPSNVTGLKWYKWGKILPDDIDDAGYNYADGKLTK